MNKYKVATNDGEVEILADYAYIGAGNTLQFTRKGEYHEPVNMPVIRGRNAGYLDPLQLPPVGYNETLYVAAFNGPCWKSYVQLNDTTEPA